VTTTPLAELARHAAARPAVILDDDPTGTQTVRDLFVLTEWDADRIARHLDDPAVFLSTNSRAVEEADAVALTRDAIASALAASAHTGRPISIVSRSDSTLRGHFPAETAAIAEAMGAPGARILLAPFFGEGGRVTVDDVHLLERDGVRTPVGETEFAADAAFGYRSSNLRDWVAEKYAAAGLPAPPVTSLPLDLARSGGSRAIADAVGALPAGGVAIANAETDADIETVALGAMLAEDAGVPLVARTAASYVRARAGQPSAPPLQAGDLGVSGPGLIVVGSHVPTTTAQLEVLRRTAGDTVVFHELSVDDVMSGAPSVIVEAAALLDRALAGGRTPVLMTERTRRDIGLAGGSAVSEALVAAVRAVSRRPAWVIAKGGITSYDVARHGLGLAEARIAGPLQAGVPVWIGGEEARWPGVPLIVFPGNVGSAHALADALASLRR
jgi:uncharacterized protein YgbK (DUF1537 family)